MHERVVYIEARNRKLLVADNAKIAWTDSIDGWQCLSQLLTLVSTDPSWCNQSRWWTCHFQVFQPLGVDDDSCCTMLHVGYFILHGLKSPNQRWAEVGIHCQSPPPASRWRHHFYQDVTSHIHAPCCDWSWWSWLNHAETGLLTFSWTGPISMLTVSMILL